jgi:hypothetical protein
MNLIYYFITVAILLVNIAGITLYMARWLPTFALARAAGILFLCTVFFFIEHFIGFGKLTWLWPITTMTAIVFLYIERNKRCTSAFWRAELVFLIAFAYGFAWKWSFPIIYPTSERITDLYFIGNYLPGQTLPPLDNWFPPNRFDFYYAFQHYAAALMGRILGFGPGLTYNLAFALLMALPITLAWDFTANFLNRPWQRWLIIVTFVIGGTGATPFVHLCFDAPKDRTEQQKIDAMGDNLWANQRFIGGFDQLLNNNLGNKLFPKMAKPDWEPRELPLEGFGYQYFVGDYHPPLGGFFLLLVVLASIGVLEKNRCFQKRGVEEESLVIDDISQQPEQLLLSKDNSFTLQMLMAFTVPLMIAVNTWVFPLQGALVFGWVIWQYLNKTPPNWKALLLGGGLSLVLLYPFLTAFVGNAIPTPIKWVQLQDHTPLAGFLAMHWPLLIFGGLSLFVRGIGRTALLFAVIFLGLLLISEYIYVDDPTGDKSERTNTVMKWWGWIWTGGLVTLSTMLLASRIRWIQGVTVLILLVINWYLIDVANYWFYTDKSAAGKLAAHSFYTQDLIVRDMFGFLEKAPYGIVLENNYGGSFTDSGIYSAFAVKPTLLGWPMHLLTWHTSIGQAWILKDQIIKFYTGELPNSADWLLANHVDYIIWNGRDALQANAWQNISKAIDKRYNWHEFNSDPNQHIGIWLSRKVAD